MIVRQVANALDLLEYFARRKSPASLAEISQTMGWPRSSTFNILVTLEERGFLYEPRPRGGYYPSPRWLSILKAINDTDLLPDNFLLMADEVAHATGETTAIAGPAGHNAVYLYVVESPATIRHSAQAGFQVPIHATSTGLALLAQYSARERASILKKINFDDFPDPAPRRPSEVEDDIKREIAQGWHVTREGSVDDLTGVALQVGGPERPLAMVVAGPSSRIRRQIPQIVAAMQRALKTHSIQI